MSNPAVTRAEAALEQVLQLPKFHSETIPAEYLDEYKHMNVRFYSELWGKGAYGLLKLLGIGDVWHGKTNYGHWLLRQVMDYKAEVREGETISIHGRMVARSAKRMHNMYWMVNESKNVVAATSEVLVANADLTSRRMTSFPEHVTEIMDAHIAEMDALGWEVPVSGAIHA